MTDHGDCNCEQAQRLQERVRLLEAEYMKLEGRLIESQAEARRMTKGYQNVCAMLRSARQRLTEEREQRRKQLRERQQSAADFVTEQSKRLLEVEQLPRLSVLDVVSQLDRPPPWKRSSTKWLVDADAVLGILCRRPRPEPPAPRVVLVSPAIRIDQLPQEPPDAERGAGTYQGQGTHDPKLQGQGGSYPDW